MESVDITGAYLHADTPPENKIVIRLNKEETSIIVEIFPYLKEYVLPDGTLLMLVDKALYGMVESAYYWFLNITTTLKDGGYVQNPSDECVFSFKTDTGEISIIDLWVDDLFHSYTKGCINLRDKLRNLLKNKYKNINIKDGNSIPYCGMLLEKDLINGGIYVSAPKFLDDLLKFENVTGKANTPTKQSFLRSDNNLNKFVNKTKYASKLMKCMWIARLCRNDILFAVTCLSTKIANPTIYDMEKLDYVLQYLNQTKDLKMKYKPDSLQLYAYIDASYALHQDAKGQSGIIISMGKSGPPVFCKSRKQKLVSRSSTESELIALNEGLPEVVWAKQFMDSLGFVQKIITVFEDNQSSIKLAYKARGSTVGRAKHIQVRYFYVKQLVDQKIIQIEYLPTEDMIADLLTKPISGKLFYKLRDLILNIK